MSDPLNGHVSRREFVRGAAALVAIPAIAGASVLERSARAAGGKADELRIGLIGCGGRGTGAALQALAADTNTVLYSVGDLFKDRVDSSIAAMRGELGADADKRLAVSAEHTYLGFDAYQKVIDSGVDVVILTSYPCFRPEHLRAAVAAGKHVFAEKPLAVDGPGIRSVLESAKQAKEKNLSVMIGFCWRHNSGMRAMFDQLHGGAIGDIRTIHSTYYTSTLSKHPRKPEWSDMEFQLRNWWHFTWTSGDHIVEQAVHSVDRMAWGFNDEKPERVICLGGRAARSGPEHGNVFDHFSAVYEYSNGRRGFLAARQIDSCPSDNSDYVEGSKGHGTINGWVPTYSLADHTGKKIWNHEGDIKDMYQVEHDELFAGIRSGNVINDCERGANSTLMAMMARMAAYTGQTLTWEQALNSQESLVPEHLVLGSMPFPAVAIPGQTKFV
ncbi:MAG TPA: Gfo/Idh/MocA family oxidoreductase [Phycisphaerales bacterium]|nr:Gfo/Idh/MocA family oxidoreductase [Phycisphaerales bacterium]